MNGRLLSRAKSAWAISVASPSRVIADTVPSCAGAGAVAWIRPSTSMAIVEPQAPWMHSPPVVSTMTMGPAAWLGAALGVAGAAVTGGGCDAGACIAPPLDAPGDAGEGAR